ncbi:uncharacterized protein LACBIDRAFT_329151 [Laccaria bicolor S238N-H82]|uniref:Predicted protein n=1 Tax=Laccaria bicolor (strain S238N-H82 / ATCC MYA-4686) TaxID=486041 RepID=B0DH80_LACBS|nr:uncharacterized protein LACBIDRAFT_329151 [Laccaria bicolor S238N-H82]EDR05969.1 predicted protein [Laccaria bicolor S238N-H82]|eukprot:XP_001883257.1 predicted protein [Laccaria bicolor S238N-H82]
MQGTFGRLCIPLQIAYHEIRGDLLETFACLFNLRAWDVGINQIQKQWGVTTLDMKECEVGRRVLSNWTLSFFNFDFPINWFVIFIIGSDDNGVTGIDNIPIIKVARASLVVHELLNFLM